VKEYDRTERVGAELQREIADIIRTEVKDPRLKLVTIQEVRPSRDLGHAKVYFTCFPVDEGGAEQVKLLNGKLSGFLRGQLARRVRMRTVPQLHFVHDESVAQGAHLSQLIEDAVASSSEEKGD
jgi:ribosome-binding factor A